MRKTLSLRRAQARPNPHHYEPLEFFDTNQTGFWKDRSRRTTCHRETQKSLRVNSRIHVLSQIHRRQFKRFTLDGHNTCTQGPTTVCGKVIAYQNVYYHICKRCKNNNCLSAGPCLTGSFWRHSLHFCKIFLMGSWWELPLWHEMCEKVSRLTRGTAMVVLAHHLTSGSNVHRR